MVWHLMTREGGYHLSIVATIEIEIAGIVTNILQEEVHKIGTSSWSDVIKLFRGNLENLNFPPELKQRKVSVKKVINSFALK